MAYKKLKVLTEAEYRSIWEAEYCKCPTPIMTCDGIQVRFYTDQFDHAFYESDNWQAKDKSILSLNRCEKMLWIKETLQDPEAVIKQAWDKKTKKYRTDRRTAVVIRKNYLVVIQMTKPGLAKFITAFEIDNDGLALVVSGPNW